MARSRKRRPQRQPQSPRKRDGGAAGRSQYPKTKRVIKVSGEQFLATLQRRGAERLDVDELMEQAEVILTISRNSEVSQLCVECMEFMASAARNAAGAVRVLERLDEADDPDLVTALKKYVEDTGEALKNVDDRLQRSGSSLAELFPELSSDDALATTWRDLIARRNVIAHRILSVDDARVREEAARDFKTLHSLLRNIHFVPTTTDMDRGRGFPVMMRAEAIRRLPAVEAGSNASELGTAVIFVFEDIQRGMQAFRCARSPENKLLVASTLTGASSRSTPTAGAPSPTNSPMSTPWPPEWWSSRRP